VRRDLDGKKDEVDIVNGKNRGICRESYLEPGVVKPYLPMYLVHRRSYLSSFFAGAMKSKM